MIDLNLEILAISCALFYCLILILKFILSIFYKVSFKQLKHKTDLAVTILQPILSGDPWLETMLSQNLTENPKANFLWLVDESDTEAIRITNRLKKSKGHNVRIVVCPSSPTDFNPKLYKINFAQNHIQTDAIIILDDDTILPRKTCQALIDGLSEYGLVTGLPRYLNKGNLPSLLLAQFTNNNAAMTYLPLSSLIKPITINGMCYSIHKNTFKKLNCFEPLLHYLTDDLAVATAVRKLNLKILQLPYGQQLHTELKNLKAYFQQMHRWFFFAVLLLRSESIQIKLIILLFQGILPIILCLLLLICTIKPVLLWIFISVIIVRFVMINILQKIVYSKFCYLPLISLISELLQPFHLVHALISNRIRWRTRKYRVYANNHFELVDK